MHHESVVFNEQVTREEMVGGEVCELDGILNEDDKPQASTSAGAVAALDGIVRKVSVERN